MWVPRHSPRTDATCNIWCRQTIINVRAMWVPKIQLEIAQQSLAKNQFMAKTHVGHIWGPGNACRTLWASCNWPNALDDGNGNDDSPLGQNSIFYQWDTGSLTPMIQHPVLKSNGFLPTINYAHTFVHDRTSTSSSCRNGMTSMSMISFINPQSTNKALGLPQHHWNEWL